MKKRTMKLLLVTAVMLSMLVICGLSANAALLGDIEGEDSTLTAADARLALRASVGLETLTEIQTALADTDENGKITAADARMILRASVGLETLGHYYEKEIILAPTCTEKGSLKAVCTECEDVYEKEIDRLGHDFPAPEVITEVTCDTDGLEKYTCQRENCGYSEERQVPAGHIPDIPAATCTEAQNCTRGNHIMTEALGHTTDWGTCTQCNVFITDKYPEQAKTIKTEFTAAQTEATTAYGYIQQSIGAASWLINRAKDAKPHYINAKAAYQKAYDACGDIPEFAEIKTKLAKNIANLNGILSQIDLVIAAGFVDSRNYYELVGPIDDLNYMNNDSIIDTDKAITKLIKW